MNFGKSIITRIIEGIIVIIVMIILMAVYSKILDTKSRMSEEQIRAQKLERVFASIDSEICSSMTKYAIYGNHLNIGGNISLSEDEKINIQGANLVLRSLDSEDEIIPLKADINDLNVKYELSDNINEGIDLEKINIGEYFIFLNVYGEWKNKEVSKYYTLKNDTKFSNNEYYTMQENNMSQKININFARYDEKNLEYMSLIAIDTILPDDVYDIVLDPGHGGRDPGAMYENKTEATYTLDYCLDLKEKLEKEGYKVKLTRTEDVYTDPYGKDGRAVVPNDVKAKLFISIHLNSTPKKNSEGGLEVYASNHENLEFAKEFATNIKTIANTTYSPNNIDKVYDGVYVRTYTKEDVEEAIEYAHDLEYEPYETLSTDTPYLFIIRETGGISTKAYMDGRNKTAGLNPHYNKNMGVEAYLLELGFINSKKDMKNIENNKEAYIDAIVKTINEHYRQI